MSGPLDGVRIVDLSTVVMGPYASSILGDMGADVIKVEGLDGDSSRQVGPARNAGMTSNYIQFNRSKRSIALNLKAPAGRDALLRIAASSDVLMSNLRPLSMDRLGLSYEDVSEVSPSIIYCGLYGFGSGGRYAGKPAYDDLIQGATAMPSLAQSSGGGLKYSPVIVADQTASLTAAYAILAALYHRERCGRGQAIEVPMFETVTQFVMSAHLYGCTFEPPIGSAGYPRLLTPDRRPFQTQDGFVCALIYSDKQWRAFLNLIGQPQMVDRAPYGSLTTRNARIEEVYAFLAATFVQQTTAHWLRALESADIPVMPLHTLNSLLDDPHLKDINFFQEVDHPTEGLIRTMAPPVKFSMTPSVPDRPAPRLGQHSREILEEAGLRQEEIASLFTSGAAADASPE